MRCSTVSATSPNVPSGCTSSPVRARTDNPSPIGRRTPDTSDPSSMLPSAMSVARPADTSALIARGTTDCALAITITRCAVAAVPRSGAKSVRIQAPPKRGAAPTGPSVSTPPTRRTRSAGDATVTVVKARANPVRSTNAFRRVASSSRRIDEPRKSMITRAGMRAAAAVIVVTSPLSSDASADNRNTNTLSGRHSALTMPVRGARVDSSSSIRVAPSRSSVSSAL